ncbi:MAG: septum site-determining protein MinC [Clostridiales bacterium]|nr:septum site-determining protein MinC [Clostridiales bacterium]
MKSKVVIKSSRFGMSVFLDPESPFDELLEAVAVKFRESARFWGNVQIALLLEGRELTPEQEFAIVNTITDNSGIEVLCLIDQNAERIERCEKAVNQKLMELSANTGQFYRGDLRRGETLESEASIVIIGDVLHGARVTAKGNVIIIGELKGSVHAGAAGNHHAVVAALEMSPLSLRIADCGQHYGDKGRKLGRGPMIAMVEDCNICTKPIKKSILNMLKFN